MHHIRLTLHVRVVVISISLTGCLLSCLPIHITCLPAGFEVTSLIELPPPGGIIALWAVVLPVLYLLSTSITNLVLRDHTILKGPCPNCGTDNFTYFGDIFTGEQGRVCC